jgi:hypothetical protein
MAQMYGSLGDHLVVTDVKIVFHVCPESELAYKPK